MSDGNDDRIVKMADAVFRALKNQSDDVNPEGPYVSDRRNPGTDYDGVTVDGRSDLQGICFGSLVMSRCELCRFARENGSSLECHRNPPPWHPVGRADWCGEWEVDHQFAICGSGGVLTKDEAERICGAAYKEHLGKEL